MTSIFFPGLTWLSALVVFMYCLRELELFRVSPVALMAKLAAPLRIVWWMALAVVAGWVLINPFVGGAQHRWGYDWSITLFMVLLSAWCVVMLQRHVMEEHKHESRVEV